MIRAPATAIAGALPDTGAPWLVRVCPPAWRPYLHLARIDRPIGWQLLLLPCWWSTALAAAAGGTGIDVRLLVMFLVGAVSMRGAGSTFNDIVDRDIDRRVERTQGRPVASGQVGVRAAMLFLTVQAAIGAVVLFSLNRFSIGLGLASLVVVALYPFAKRVTHWPQAVLGLAFAWGALMGWAAVVGNLAWPAVLLYGAAIFWTMGYDTIYALQDTRDDAAVGIGSTALFFGAAVRPGVAVLYGLAILCAVASCIAAHLGLAAHLGVAAFGLHLAWQVARIDRHDTARSLLLFRSNRNAGLLVFLGLLAEIAIRRAG